jgi:hypothetical protein
MAYIVDTQVTPETLALATHFYHTFLRNSALGEDLDLSLFPLSNLDEDTRGNWCAVALEARRQTVNELNQLYGLPQEPSLFA